MHRRERHPKDPRNRPSYRPRGLQAWRYTYADIAALAGVSIGAAKKARVRGKLDPGDLRSVLAWIRARHDRKERAAR